MNKKVFFIFLLFVIVDTGYSYLDPGTWTYILQIIVATLVGGVVAIKTFWQNIKDFVFSLFNKKKK